MTKEDKIVINKEIANTFELYGFQMSFSEFKDVFELAAEFGYNLAKINESVNVKHENVLHVVNIRSESAAISNQKIMR
ncbi:MAG TPA: hypothetical protein VF623_01955 [Segetibacter sp.]|jgi:hypothetical protein